MTATTVDEQLDCLLEQWPDEPAPVPAQAQAEPEPVRWTIDGTAECALAHDVTAPAAARHLIHTVLAGRGLPDEVIDNVLLVTSELVTNAVEHAQAPLTLHVRPQHTGKHVWIGVTDGGPAQIEGAWMRSCTPDEHGRGYTIITALTHTHGHHTHPNGHHTHWAHLTTR